MDLKEYRKQIAESQHAQELNQLTLKVDFPKINQSSVHKGLYNIYKFFVDQQQLWKKQKTELPAIDFNQSISFFNSAVKLLINFIQLVNGSYFGGNLDFEWRNVQKQLVPNNQVLPHSSAEVDFLINLFKEKPSSFNAALNFITDNTNAINLNTKDNIIGAVLAYEFLNSESSKIFNRRESDKKFISKMRSEIETLSNDYQNELTTHIKQTTEDYTDYKEKLDNFEKSSNESLSQWMITHKGAFETFHKSSQDKIQALEKQYSELLKLQEPVKYWKDRAIELNKKANQMLWVVVAITVVAVFLTYALLWLTPEGMLNSIFKGDTTAAIRWSIIFAIFISFIAFLVRAIMKYMFSNYHLARDAEEREKLTYLYISLLSHGKFSEDERKIVMQSLFSRSDTGLLKEDSSPTMPALSAVFDKHK